MNAVTDYGELRNSGRFAVQRGDPAGSQGQVNNILQWTVARHGATHTSHANETSQQQQVTDKLRIAFDMNYPRAVVIYCLCVFTYFRGSL